MEQDLKLQQKYQALLRESAQLGKQIEDFKSRGVSTDLQPQMRALHEYNEMKDLTQNVLSYLANAEQISASELHMRYNLPLE